MLYAGSSQGNEYHTEGQSSVVLSCDPQLYKNIQCTMMTPE